MIDRRTGLALMAGVVAAGLVATAAPAQENVQFIPSLVYRTGPYGPNGEPFANGVADYYNLINERDGGINGIKIVFEECDTQYNNDKGVECYERLKNKGPTGAAVFSPLSTGITYALIERATADKIPIFSMGYGRSDAAYGKVFPYIFNPPANYWSQATSIIKYVAEQEGGLDKLKGKEIALVYHDSAYGKEPIPTLQKLEQMYGFKLSLHPVAHPGLEQKATWLKIGRRVRPDWVLMWGWGVMNSTAIKEAAAVGFPMERFIGNWWSGSENDVKPAGDAAVGYKSANFHGAGANWPVHQDIFKYVYDKGLGAGQRERVGEVLYNRGVTNAMIVVEAIRTAQKIHGVRPLTGAEVRDGFEALNITEERLKELGMEGFMLPLKLSCADHEGGGPVYIQQWDGQKWNKVSDWYYPMRDVVWPMIEESALKYAKEKGITPRDCPQG